MRTGETLFALTDAGTIAVDLRNGNLLTVLLGASRSIGAPSNGVAGQIVTMSLTNNTGGAITTTWNAAWHLAGAWVDPATTKQRSIGFYTADGTIFRELWRTAADVTP